MNFLIISKALQVLMTATMAIAFCYLSGSFKLPENLYSERLWFGNASISENAIATPLVNWQPGCRSGISLGQKCSSNEVYLPMQITFRQSGGYAGLIMGCQIDTNSLTAEEAADLQTKVKQSGILQAQSQKTPHAADLLNYEITIETSQGKHQVTFDDSSLPQEALPLLEYLQRRAKPLR